MNTEQLGRLLTALEAIAANTARIADAVELDRLSRVIPSANDLRRNEVISQRATPTDLNSKGPYA